MNYLLKLIFGLLLCGLFLAYSDMRDVPAVIELPEGQQIEQYEHLLEGITHFVSNVPDGKTSGCQPVDLQQDKVPVALRNTAFLCEYKDSTLCSINQYAGLPTLVVICGNDIIESEVSEVTGIKSCTSIIHKTSKGRIYSRRVKCERNPI